MKKNIIQLNFKILLFMYCFPFFAQQVVLTNTVHPYIFLNPQKITQLNNLYQSILSGTNNYVPFNNNQFPITGSLSFKFYVDTAGLKQTEVINLFEDYTSNQTNRICLVIPSWIYSNNTSNKFDSCILAFRKSDGTSPVYKTFKIKAQHWNQLTIGWNTTSDSAYYKLEYYINNTWVTFRYNKFKILNTAWVPSNQNFIFRNNGYIDDVTLYSSYLPQSSSMLMKFNMNQKSNISNVVDSVQSVNASVKYNDTLLSKFTYNNTGSSLKLTNNYLNYYSLFSLDPINVQAGALLNLLKSAKEKYLNYNTSSLNCSNHSRDYLQFVFGSALIYKITGDTNYRNKAFVFIDSICKINTTCDIIFGAIDDQAISSKLQSLGLFYDWMYADLSPTRKQNIIQRIKLDLSYHTNPNGAWQDINIQLCGNGGFTAGTFTCNVPASNPHFFGGHNYEINSKIIYPLLSVINDEPLLQDALNKVVKNFTSGFDPMGNYLYENGGHPMGYAYPLVYDYWQPSYLINTLTNMNTSFKWSKYSYLKYLYALRGNLSFPRIGDVFGGNQKWLLGSMNDKGYGVFASRFHNDGYATSFLQDLSSYDNAEAMFYKLIFGDSLAQNKNYTNLPKSRFFKTSGIVSCRDSWDFSDAVLLNFKSSSIKSCNHVHADNNSFELYYKGPIFVDAGNYDNYGTPHWLNYYTKTIAHNAITVYNPNYTYTPNSINDGGQFHFEDGPLFSEIQQNASNWIKGIDTTKGFDNHISEDYTYIKGDATLSYPSLNVKKTIREIVFTRNGIGSCIKPIILVFDKVVSKDSNYITRVHWHTQQKPTKQNNSYLINNGQVNAYLNILQPTNYKDTLIGGAGYEYYVNNPITGGGTNFPVIPSATSSIDTLESGKWRIDVSSHKKDTSNFFLHSIFMNDVGSNFNIPTVISKDTNNLQYAIINQKLLVTFSKTDTSDYLQKLKTNLNISEAIFTGLYPNTNYDLIQNSTEIGIFKSTSGPYLSSNAGVVYIKNINFTDSTAGVKKYSESQTTINIYPNPFTSNLCVTSFDPITTIVIYDVFGRQLFEKKPNSELVNINLEDYKNGIYIMQISTSKNRTFTNKVIKH